MPARREVLAALGACGLSAGTASGTETATPARAEEPFATDFDHPASALDERGWTVEHGSFGIEDSYLVADGGAGNLDYQLSRPQPSPAGTFEFRGVRNEHPFYGLRFSFVSESRSFGEPPVAGGTQHGYQIVLRNTQNGGKVELERTDGDGAETLLTLAEDHGGALTDVRVERDPDTWEFHCYLDGEHVGSVHDDTYTDSSYWVQKHGAGDSQRVDGLAARPAGADGSSSPDGTTTTASAPGSADEDHDWLENWTPLFAWLVGVPLLGPLVLAALVAATDRHSDEPSSTDSEGEA